MGNRVSPNMRKKHPSAQMGEPSVLFVLENVRRTKLNVV